MTDQFNIQIGRLMSVFGKKNFQSEARLAMIWDAVRGLEPHQFLSIVDHIIANCRNAPLPNDFREAAKGLKRYDQEHTLSPISKPPCLLCLDCGAVLVRHLEGSNEEFFMKCDCGSEQSAFWDLPIYGSKYQKYFVRQKMDSERWRPAQFNPKAVSLSLQAKANEWKVLMKKSQKFWKEHLSKNTYDHVSSP